MGVMDENFHYLCSLKNLCVKLLLYHIILFVLERGLTGK